MALLPVKASMSLAEAQTIVAPEICLMNRGADNRQAGIDVFQLELLTILEFYGVNWSEKQVDEAANLLFSEYYYWTFAELKLFSSRVKMAQFDYLKDYSKLAPKHIMQCAGDYDGELLEARRMRAEKPKEQHLFPAATPAVTQEQIDEAMRNYENLKQKVASERVEQERLERQARDQAQEKMIRQYCKHNNLDYDEMKFTGMDDMMEHSRKMQEVIQNSQEPSKNWKK